MMEEVYEFVKEKVEEIAEAQFQTFKTLHEIRLRDSASSDRKINEAVLLEVDRDPVVVLKPLCTKEQFMEALEMMDPADIAKLRQRKGLYSVIVTKFDIWIKCLLNSKKQEYLSKLLSTKKPKRSKRDYEDLFINSKDAQTVEDLIKGSPYYKDGKFYPLHGSMSAIVKAFFVLREMNIVVRNPIEESSRTFCEYFGVYDLASDTLRKEGKLFQEGDDFKVLFSGLN